MVSCNNLYLMKKLTSNILLLLVSLLCAAQGPYFKNFNTSDGLPNNTVLCTVQDRQGFLWLGTKDGICRFDGTTFQLFGNDSSQHIMSGITSSLTVDKDGMIWFSNSFGVGYYNPYNDEIKSVLDRDFSMMNLICDKEGDIWMFGQNKVARFDRENGVGIFDIPFKVNQACTDSDGDIWICDLNGKLWHFDRRQSLFEGVVVNMHGRMIPCVRLSDAGLGRLLVIGPDNSLYRYHIDSHRVELLDSGGLKNLSVNLMMRRTDSEYWIGCMQGLYIYYDQKGLSGRITNDSSHSIQDSNVIDMSVDRNGNVWLGTYHSGFSVWYNRIHEVSQFVAGDSDHTFKGRFVRAIEGDDYGNIWVGTEDGFLNVFFVSRSSVTQLGPAAGLPADANFHSLMNDGDRMWVATFNRGVFLVDVSQLRVRKHYELEDNFCGCIIKGSGGEIYVGTRSGLFVYNKSKDSFERSNDFSGLWVHAVYEDSRGRLWIGTYGSGLYVVENGETLHIDTQTPEYGLETNYILSFLEDSEGRVLIATEGCGLCYAEPGDEIHFNYLSRKNGFPSNVASSMIQDKNGTLWVATANGLVEMDARTLSVRELYLDETDTFGDNYSYCSGYMSAAGAVHFGTTCGLMKFEPEGLSSAEVRTPVYIVDIHAGNKRKVLPLKSAGHSTITSEEISVKSSDAAYLSISFASPDFSDFKKRTYEYTLKSRRNLVTATTEDHTVVFTDLRPGAYKFKVGVEGEDYPESSRSISILIRPPFYKALYFRIISALLIIVLLAYIVYLIRKKDQLERIRENERMESAKLKEITEAKINFFTNITHEIRTPLTLIKLPIDKIVEEKEYTEESKEDILTIQANTDRLLNLTNQLIDIKKIEKREYGLNLTEFDIVKFCWTMWKYFSAGIRERHIKGCLDLPEKQITVCSDADFLEKIICNLLSNAVKYGESSVSMKLVEDSARSFIRIMVDSDGDLISESDYEKVFEPFYQIRTVNSQLKGSSGTGLGLPYARNLAKALGGNLYVDGKRKDCNSFVLEFPAISIADTREPEVHEELKEEKTLMTDCNRHWILVVEDSAEMNRYLCKQLEKEYNMLSASNGEEALSIIRNERVDLVISDIMMPIMDGCELCNNIKKDEEYSHIPVILVTAAVGVETRIQTLEVGADGYIEKPFTIELLRANIDNLFKNREIAYRQFANSPLSHFKSLVASNVDQEFMDKLHNAVMENISSQDLSIDTLTEIMFTSKSTLYRKVKANTGVNVNEYIRICRLKKAAEMLSTQKYRINEVAYLTGFSSPSYFATSFQKQFNVSPSNFVKKLTGKA